MNIRQLEAFRAVMMTGSMMGGAQMLRVSQPAVSQLIAQLEQSSSLKLFERRHGRIFPTPDANLIFAEVEQTFSGLEKVERTISSIRGHNWGRLSIAAFPALMRRLLPRILSQYSALHPEIEISLDSEHSRNMGDLVARREVDLALSILPNDRAEVEALKIFSGAGLCVLPVSHRLAGHSLVRAEDLEGEPFISLGSSDLSRFAIDNVFHGRGITRILRIQATQSEAACAFVAEGQGVAVVDPVTVFDYQDPRIVFLPFEPVVEFSLWLIRPRFSSISSLAENFTEYLQRCVPALLEKR